MIADILWRNQGQVLTPELIVGIVHAANFVPDMGVDFSNIEPVVHGDFTFHVQRYIDALPELKELHHLHWLETEKHRHNLPFNMNYEDYLRADRAGGIVLFTIRKEGRLVGQSTMRLHFSTHTQTLVSDEDTLFLHSDYRGGSTIFKFIAYMDDVLTGMGVKEVRVSSKIINSADKLMMRCGFVPFATQLVKFLGVKNET